MAVLMGTSNDGQGVGIVSFLLRFILINLMEIQLARPL
jgi:hypothetical protein